jgi:hypothetical protein
MIDVREQILDRLRTLGKVRGVATVFRNAPIIGDGEELPAVIIYDGDETVAKTPPGRAALQPVLVTASPYFHITVHGDSDVVGEEINTLRMRLIAAVLKDDTLIAMSAENRSVFYDGLNTAYKHTRATQGDMAVRFLISYYLQPSHLL